MNTYEYDPSDSNIPLEGMLHLLGNVYNNYIYNLYIIIVIIRITFKYI